MRLKSLYCKNFRNFKALDLAFREGGTLITGNNGVGKTNLLEMVYFLSTFSSFRTSKTTDLLHFAENFFTVSGIYGDTEVKVKYSGRKEISVNGLKQESQKEAFGTIPVVALTNEDIEIINGSPSKRRYFINISISLYNRTYINHLYEYRRVRKQRNKLLLRAKKGEKVKNIELWEKQLIKSIYPIVEVRRDFIEKLSAHVEGIFKELTGKKVKIEYVPGGDYSDIGAQFGRKRKKEIEVGYTLFGPHRDDIEFTVNGHTAKVAFSFGLKRLLVISLKMAISRILTERREEEPILLIDEMLGGLDRKNSNSLAEFLKRSRQVLIATTEEELGKNKGFNKYRIKKRNGTPFVRECTEKVYSV